MHKAFRKYLEKAHGVSEFVIAINLDIRGYSAFSTRTESPDAAMFIKRVFMRLIDEYFTKASFYKSTGDGLLLTIPYDENNLKDRIQETINICLKAIKVFPLLCKNDPMINFQVPTKIGVGLSRGTACRLVSGTKTIDYSGRILNLASRLMDFARPYGIVFDSGFGYNLLNDTQKELFKNEKIYIKGIAEKEPVSIYYTNMVTEIPIQSKKPIQKERWESIALKKSFREIKSFGSFTYPLKEEPIDQSSIRIMVEYPSIENGKVQKDVVSYIDSFKEFRYEVKAGIPELSIDYSALVKELTKVNLKNNHKITLTISYLV